MTSACRLSRTISPIQLPFIKVARKSPRRNCARQRDQTDHQTGPTQPEQFSQPLSMCFSAMPEELRPCTVMRSRLRCGLPRTCKLVRESKAVPQFQRVGP